MILLSRRDQGRDDRWNGSRSCLAACWCLYTTVSTALSSTATCRGLSRPEQVVYFFRDVVGVQAVDKEVLSGRTGDYQDWVEAFARNHEMPIEWAEKGVRKEDYVRRWLRSMERRDRFGVYFIFKSMEQGPSFRCTVPKYPTHDPNHRILAPQRSRFTHYYFYIRDEVLGPIVMRVASFFPFQTTY